jgi:hypothetical protein
MFVRALRDGLSSLRDRAAARLAGSRFNPSRVEGPCLRCGKTRAEHRLFSVLRCGYAYICPDEEGRFTA